MQYLYGKSHIKNMKRNHQEKYNLIFNQIIFSSNINRNSKILIMGLPDNVLVKDLLNRGYSNVHYSNKYDEIHHSKESRDNNFFDLIDYDVLKNRDDCSKYDLLIINTAYDISKLDIEFNDILKSLKSGGTLILMFNAYIKAHSPVWSGIRDLYKTTLPSLFDGDVMSLEDQMKKLKFMVNSREQLGDMKSHDYNWIEEYTINEYCNLIQCNDSYKSMDVTKQMKVAAQLHQTIDNNGGSLKKANRMTVLSCNKI